MIGLKIMLKHGHFISLGLEPAEALKAISMWSALNESGKGAKMLGSHNVKCPPNSPTWSVECSEIVGMHTFSLDDVQGQMPMQGGYKSQFGRSGI